MVTIGDSLMSQPLNFDRMITEGAKRWREVAGALDAAKGFVDAAANDPTAVIC